MFGYKKNKKPFKLHINKKNAAEEYMEYMSQPPEVLENLRKCKIFMAIFIPVGIITEHLANRNILSASQLIEMQNSAYGLNIKNANFSVSYFDFEKIDEHSSKNRLENWKLRLVPLICLFTGWIMGTFCIQKIILMILNVVG